MRCLRTPKHCDQYASGEDGWGSAGRHSRRCFGLSGAHTQALTVLKPSCGKRVSSCCGAAVQSGGAAGVYLQLGTELGRNVDLHGAADVVEQMPASRLALAAARAVHCSHCAVCGPRRTAARPTQCLATLRASERGDAMARPRSRSRPGRRNSRRAMKQLAMALECRARLASGRRAARARARARKPTQCFAFKRRAKHAAIK